MMGGGGTKEDAEGQRLKDANLTPRKGQKEEDWGNFRPRCSLRKAQHNSWGPGTVPAVKGL